MSTSSSSSSSSSRWQIDVLLSSWKPIAIGAAGIVSLIPISYLVRYRQDIKRRLQAVEDELSKPLMIREPYDYGNSGGSDDGSGDDAKDTQSSQQQQQQQTSLLRGKQIRCLELNPEFVKRHSDKWHLVSLGQYLGCLRPSLPGGSSSDRSGGSGGEEKDDRDLAKLNTVLPQFIERELEATIGSVLLRALGRRFGGAILPLLGITDVHSRTANIAGSIASWWLSHFLVSQAYLDKKNLDPLVDNLQDAGPLPFNLNEIVSLANINEKFVPSMMTIKSLEWMRRGEIGYDPSFGGPPLLSEKGHESSPTAKTGDSDNDATDDLHNQLIPNPFVVSMHWDAAIEGMQKLMRSKDVVKARETPNAEEKEESTASYDPESRDFPEPTPVNERLLPDLHLGWGDAKCTHTKQEIIRNRLLSVLLNKLSYNYYKKEQRETDLFIVKMTTKEVTRKEEEEIWCPHHFLQALIDSGHKVEMCPRATMTSFGMALCVKEKDNTFSNIPIGIFLRSGYEKANSHPAHYVMPHGGMDLRVVGPLVGKNSNGDDPRCDVQFYMAIEGMCGWHSNHNADVPWLQSTASTDIYTNDQALLAVKLAAILAVTFNALGTEMDLPYGGYGIMGVCNDTAALLDYGVRGETDMFPLVSTGRFMIHSSRRLIHLYNNIKEWDGGKKFEDDVRRLIIACCEIQSDLLASPSNLISSSNRFLASQPETLCFQIEQESKTIMTTLKDSFDQFDEKLTQMRPSIWN